MDVYIYQAALHCDECGHGICKDLKAKGEAPDDPKDESSYDSDDYPKGPFADGGGEADCPQHCDSCGVFLENPLTSEGAAYVEEAVQTALADLAAKSAKLAGGMTPDEYDNQRSHSVALTTWASFYDIHPELSDES